jgi:hypothetical protein
LSLLEGVPRLLSGDLALEMEAVRANPTATVATAHW